MPGTDFSALNAKIEELKTNVTNAETVDASASALIAGFADAAKKAVADALAADDAADQGSIDAANQAIEDVKSRLTASSKALGDAVVANTPSAP